ncbi:MAG: 2-oxoglutarate dehydrogenase E1 component [Gammaproteobacteria bacterium]|nr:MAG: 2-oxoglutarate dehydrogenase E1 component [Gammaproteobacteria bacterium]
MDENSKQTSLQQRWQSSTLADGNAPYLETLYENYLQDPESVDQAWRRYFDGLPRVNGTERDVSHAEIRSYFRDLVRRREPVLEPRKPVPGDLIQERKQVKVLQLINAYRFRGHQEAMTNPLAVGGSTDIPELHLRYHGLSDDDFDTAFDTGSLVGPARATLREILEILQATYCGAISVEYMHLTDTAEKRWMQNQVERERGHPIFSPLDRRRLLDRLNAAEGMERYLHTKYAGQKRFSLEGAESLIPLLDSVIHHGGTHGIKEVAIGMAHRGRLNVLINIMGKTPKDLFLEFEGKNERRKNASGDVKYHMGFSSDIQTEGGVVHVALAFNPSHLEIVGPVVEGSVRARQDWRQDKDGSEVLPVLIHGDAAFAGQGVVMETFNMSQSRGYSTKGTLHIVINNQIGFTTSSQNEARSTYYCTDAAKMVSAPILHANGDDPEAVRFVTQVALDYRMAFRKDIVIDLVCYRRHGHSEADEPMVTQPMMYRKIKAKPTACTLYSERLLHDGLVTEESLKTMHEDYRNALDAGNPVALDMADVDEVQYSHSSKWQPFSTRPDFNEIDTGLALETLRRYSDKLRVIPAGFELHRSVQKILDNRGKMAAGALPIDWGFAETMAYASLVGDGHHVRLSGQDSGRGTFFHRHAILYNQHNGEAYIPLQYIKDGQGRFLVINSLLSEEAVLAFEYGYATTTPDTLVIWEAQFGDFANNAQVVIDQFISAGELKWNRLCGLVMFLPHGYEGQGPEHSSARLERYMQLCAEQNIQVCVPTTPAQIFHLLRRQMLRNVRKPLVVMTPKSLLRHRLAVSSLEDLTQGGFQAVIPEADDLDPQKVKRVVMCSGRVYYDLLEKRRKEERSDVVLIRIEQLYPFPRESLKMILDSYPQADSFVWCQEEPKNQGAWYTSQHNVRALLKESAYLEYAGRPASAAPAAGYAPLHIKQLHYLLDEALNGYTEK